MSYKIHLIDQDAAFTTETDETILEAALRQKYNLPYGCRNGLCGSCKAIVKSADYTYPNGIPDGLSEAEIEQGYVLLCQARG